MLPAPANLSEIFEHFILYGSDLRSSELLEIGGAQVLLLAGFFRDQMKDRYPVGWYDEIGQSFYGRAARYARNKTRIELMDKMSKYLPFWTITCRNLNRSLQEERLLLKVN